jgi:hypothetical protein
MEHFGTVTRSNTITEMGKNIWNPYTYQGGLLYGTNQVPIYGYKNCRMMDFMIAEKNVFGSNVTPAILEIQPLGTTSPNSCENMQEYGTTLK